MSSHKYNIDRMQQQVSCIIEKTGDDLYIIQLEDGRKLYATTRKIGDVYYTEDDMRKMQEDYTHGKVKYVFSCALRRFSGYISFKRNGEILFCAKNIETGRHEWGTTPIKFLDPYCFDIIRVSRNVARAFFNRLTPGSG